MKTLRLVMCAVAGMAMWGAGAALAVAPGGGRGVTIIRPTPAPPAGWVYRWVGPVYQTISDRVWVPEKVEMVPQWMEIGGRLEQVWRQVVTPGRWELHTRQVLVSEGHYELVRIEPPPVIISPPIVINPPVVVRNPGTVGVEGYKSGPTEDLSKFSPLKEWPK